MQKQNCINCLAIKSFAHIGEVWYLTTGCLYMYGRVGHEKASKPMANNLLVFSDGAHL
jgi:hypothetical protein